MSRLIRNLRRLEGFFRVPHIFFLKSTYLFAVKKHPPRRPPWGEGGRKRESSAWITSDFGSMHPGVALRSRERKRIHGSRTSFIRRMSGH